MKEASNHKGWYSRGYLPHFDGADFTQFITFRLVDSLPIEMIHRWKEELQHLPDNERQREERSRLMKYLDLGVGECWLQRPEIAQIVENALLHFDNERYRLHAWTIMPNHIHVLATFDKGHALSKAVHSWKSFTAKEANKVLNREGEFWFREFYDRFIRSDAHFGNVLSYIDQNPVKAGLCQSAPEWPFGSARLGEVPNFSCQRDAGAPCDEIY